MKTFFSFGDLHYRILYKCSFTEPLTLFCDVIFDKINVMNTSFLENLGVYSQDWQLCSEFFMNVALQNP